MAEFTADAFHNEFLLEGATDVHAIVAVTCSKTGTAGGAQTAFDAAEIIMVDTSGSMNGRNMEAARDAASVAVDRIVDGTWFAIIAGNHVATRTFPYPNARMAMVRMEPAARAEAKRAIATMRPGGGTAMSTWLRLALELFATLPAQTQCHAILLTDGKNESEPRRALRMAVRDAEGAFQCDARGVGTRWQVDELREIATTLLGTVGLIAGPEEIAKDFAELMTASMARGVASAELRVWAPQDAHVLFVRQVAPRVEDLTQRRSVVNPLTGSYPTGSWGDETRDYHVAIRVPSKPVGAEQLAARVQLAVNGEVMASALVKAKWSADESLTTHINAEVAHYTGQADLATAIQEGLAAKATGNLALATRKLGRAVRLAEQTGNTEATSRLRKVVEIDDPATGAIRLKPNTDRLDEMALDTASTKTTRVRR